MYVSYILFIAHFLTKKKNHKEIFRENQIIKMLPYLKRARSLKGYRRNIQDKLAERILHWGDGDSYSPPAKFKGNTM